MNKSNEAPRSATVGVTSPKGYEWLVSIREDDTEVLLSKIEGAESYFSKNGWTPTKKQFGFKKTDTQTEYAKDPCPTCGKRLVKGKTKDGREFVKCESQKYDFKNKTTSGCPYFSFI